MNFGKASDHDAVVFLGLVMGIVRGNLFFHGYGDLAMDIFFCWKFFPSLYRGDGFVSVSLGDWKNGQ